MDKTPCHLNMPKVEIGDRPNSWVSYTAFSTNATYLLPLPNLTTTLFPNTGFPPYSRWN